MKYLEHEMHHFYNQGNNREIIFKTHKDYVHFLELVTKYISPHCEIFAYCLMPNHFHFLIYTNKKSVDSVQLGMVDSNRLTNGFRLLLSQYALFFNAKYERSGSLFRQKTKSKCLDDSDSFYALDCLLYIHQNPKAAGLVDYSAKWKYSSCAEYNKSSNYNICNLDLAHELIGGIPVNDYFDDIQVVTEHQFRNVFKVNLQ